VTLSPSRIRCRGTWHIHRRRYYNACRSLYGCIYLWHKLARYVDGRVRVITGRNAALGSATALRGMIHYGLTLESSMTRDSSRPSWPPATRHAAGRRHYRPCRNRSTCSRPLAPVAAAAEGEAAGGPSISVRIADIDVAEMDPGVNKPRTTRADRHGTSDPSDVSSKQWEQNNGQTMEP